MEGLNWLESFCALNEKLNRRDFPRRIIGNSWASGRQAGELSWQAGNNFNLISWSLCILHVQYIHGVFTILFGSLLNCKITCYDEKQPRITIRYHTSYTKKFGVFFLQLFLRFLTILHPCLTAWLLAISCFAPQTIHFTRNNPSTNNSQFISISCPIESGFVSEREICQKLWKFLLKKIKLCSTFTNSNLLRSLG